MSTSKEIKLIWCIIFFLPIACSGGKNNYPPELKSEGYSIFFEDNFLSEKYGEYLYRHMLKRSKENKILEWNKENKNYKKIVVSVCPSLEFDYEIIHIPEKITLKIKNEADAIWIIYQFIRQLATYDDRFDANDLPPAIINFNTHSSNFDFTYRDPHFRPNLEKEYGPIIGTNSIESDWGIWGHNLSKILNLNTESIFARRQGVIDKNQFCFSSPELFSQISDYISDNWGGGLDKSVHFMIMPNDNTIVCDCDRCKRLGNMTNNATPAVSQLIVKLATRYPNHQFFTSAYKTTAQPPDAVWPNNTGILISTIDLPKGVNLEKTKQSSFFVNTLLAWKNCTSNIYIWDYASNFDDYLTPIPILYGLQKQLRYYKKNGIKGVFLNGSGYDYSSFDDVKTYVSAALMMNVELSIDDLCKKYFYQYYPVSGKVLCDYYLALEQSYDNKNIPYSLYSGFKEASSIYFDKASFIELYESLQPLINISSGIEKFKLQELYTALSYTRLQLAYWEKEGEYGFANKVNKSMIVKPEISSIASRFSNYKYYEYMSVFKETDGNIDDYLRNWKKLIDDSHYHNLLIGETLSAISQLDEDFKQLTILNDGVLGFDDDYHQGWFQCSIDDLHIQIDTKNIPAAKKISIRFLNDAKHRIYKPSKVEIFKNNVLYKEATIPTDLEEGITNVITVSFDIDLSDANNLSLKVYRNVCHKGSIVCDEIQVN